MIQFENKYDKYKPNIPIPFITFKSFIYFLIKIIIMQALTKFATLNRQQPSLVPYIFLAGQVNVHM